MLNEHAFVKWYSGKKTLVSFRRVTEAAYLENGCP